MIAPAHESSKTQWQTLLIAFSNKPLAEIEPLATPSVLQVVDVDGRPPLWVALW